MKLVPNIPNPRIWEKFYTDMANGSLKSIRHSQRGGGSLGPRVHSKHYTRIHDTVEPTIVSPTEMAVQQARSEVSYRADQNSTRPSGVKRSALQPRNPSGPKRKPPPQKHTKTQAKAKSVSKGSGARRGRTTGTVDVFSNNGISRRR